MWSLLKFTCPCLFEKWIRINYWAITKGQEFSMRQASKSPLEIQYKLPTSKIVTLISADNVIFIRRSAFVPCLFTASCKTFWHLCISSKIYWFVSPARGRILTAPGWHFPLAVSRDLLLSGWSQYEKKCLIWWNCEGVAEVFFKGRCGANTTECSQVLWQEIWQFRLEKQIQYM